MSLWDFCIRRPVFTTVLMVTLLAVGAMGYTRMGVDLMPDFDIPVVNIVTTMPGADPEVMDQDVTDLIESEVGTLEGVDAITSQSFEGYCSVTVQFLLERDIDVAAQEVRDKISKLQKDLPTGIDPPIVQKVDPASSPIIWLAVYGDADAQQLSDLADNVIKERLQSLPGVGSLYFGGFRERTVRVWLDPAGMRKYDVGPAQVVAALQAWHVELPGGRIENEAAESTIKMKGEFASLAELENMAVDWRGGAPIRLKDVARVEDGEADLRTIARLNGQPSVALGVRKQSGANTVGVAEAVVEKIPELQALMPPGVKLQVVFDNSKFIKDSVHGVGFDLIFGAAFTAAVIFLFLRHGTMTLISVIAIPTSLLGAFGFMYFMDFTVNQITMLAMSLSVGLVIDDAIVVLENIHRHMEHEGQPPAAASSSGTGEVAFAVLAATMAIAGIFLPVAFMGGVIGRVFYQFGVSVGLAITLSLVVSLTMTPMLCARWLRAGTHEGALSRMVLAFLDWLDRTYRTLLTAAIRTRATRVGVLVLAVVAFGLGLLVAGQVGMEFAPADDRSQFQVYLETPIGTSITETDRRAREAERILASHKEIRQYLTTVGDQTGQINKVNLLIDMVPRHDRTISQQELMDQLRVEMNRIPGVIAYPANISNMGGGGTRTVDLEFTLQGADLLTLERISNEIMRRMSQDPTFKDISDDLELIQPQVSVYPDRDAAADVKVDTRQIAVALQAMMGGVDISKFKIDGQRYDIRVKADDSFRRDAEAIRRIVLRTPGGSRVEMGSVVDVVEGLGPNSIKRYNRMRSVTIMANVAAGIAIGDASEKFMVLANDVMKAYPGYQIAASGMTKIMNESFQYLMFALASSIVIIYLILAAQFESFIHPFTIMMTLPLAIVGVFLGLLLTGKTFSIFAIIGLIMLVGIVTRNGILLVDFANQQRAKGVPAHQAMLMAGPVRLRPILMTALAAMVGILPVALGLSEGGESRSAMGVAVIGGLLTSTLLTLFVIPTAYLTFEGIVRNLGLVRDRIYRLVQSDEREHS